VCYGIIVKNYFYSIYMESIRQQLGKFAEFRSVEKGEPGYYDLVEHLQRQRESLGSVENKPESPIRVAKERRERLQKNNTWNPAENPIHLAILRTIEAGMRRPSDSKRTFAQTYNDYAHKQGYSRADSLVLAKTCPNTKDPVVPEKYRKTTLKN
jgi:hypothetical protein